MKLKLVVKKANVNPGLSAGETIKQKEYDFGHAKEAEQLYLDWSKTDCGYQHTVIYVAV